MRALNLLLLASLALAPCSLAFAPYAHGGDAPDDTSDASKAFREAWWAETGGGDLAAAVGLYNTAAFAEGPASVKARALYRMAVVLQRIGKTEEAIRALERLAKDHPGEATLQTDGRARLAEWTAVDLKSSFAEWYRRYQYSPEFQAKIVDLVLKLGASDAAVGVAASNEILTIGAPALPALKQHLDSSNAQLRERVASALLLLGEVPSFDALRRNLSWRNDPACWAKLKSALADARSRLRTEAKADQPWDLGIMALLDGPVAFLTWANMPAAKSAAEALLSQYFVWDVKDADPSAVRPLLRALAENQALAEEPRKQVMYKLLAIEGIDAARAESWALGDDRFLRTQGVGFLVDPRGGPDTRAALRRVVKAAAKWDDRSSLVTVSNGMFERLSEVPVGPALDELADDLLAITEPQHLSARLSVSARTVLVRMIDRVRLPQLSASYFSAWHRPNSNRTPSVAESDADPLVVWIRSGSIESIRNDAIDVLATGPVSWQKRAIALLGEEGLPTEVGYRLFANLLQSRSAAFLLSDPALRRAILDAWPRGAGAAPNAARHVAPFLSAVVRLPIDARREIAAEFLRDPVAFPPSLFQTPNLALNNPASEALWRAALGALATGWRQAWPAWTPAQRDAAVNGLDALFLPSNDAELRPFLQACARDRSNGISMTSRTALLRYLDPITTEDFRTALDLETPAGADAAIRLIHIGANLPDPLPADLFDALRLGLRPDGPEVSARTLRALFQDDVRVFRRLLEALLAHHDQSVPMSAVAILAERESSDDLPLWLVALASFSVDVRAKAASGLGRIAHPDATKALVKALDDPNSSVRDAVIASLEAIQKIEDLKKTWREKVR